jgi:glycosyltransferase involved in cell wall biosynthesis
MAAARLLDLTRSLRRAGRVATGIDRVEHAYLEYLLADDVPLFGLARTAFGYVLLDQGGMRAFSDRIEGQVPWGDVDLLSRMPRGRTEQQKKAESDIRRLAIVRALPSKLPKVLAKVLPDGYVYYNVGHSNLTDRVLRAIRKSGGRTAAMVHDVIPLEHPEFQREGSVEPFREKMCQISAQADWVIFNSHDTQTRTEKFMHKWGRMPDPIVAHLGTTVPPVDVSQLPDGLPIDRPYFVTVSTIEPRKNHAFLLDLWQELGAEAPPLFMCGTRGWNNDAVFSRLDRLTAEDNIYEFPGLSDPALAGLVQGAAGSLFPSLAEGYGFPPLEALALGSRVLCNDLHVLREILGNKPVYAPVSDRYLWINTIKNWEKNPPHAQKVNHFVGPTWSDHFKTVLRLR